MCCNTTVHLKSLASVDEKWVTDWIQGDTIVPLNGVTILTRK